MNDIILYSKDNNVSGVKKNLASASQIDLDESLIISCERGYSEIVKILLDAGADPNTSEGDPLAEACRNNHIEVIHILLDAGADPNISDGYPLMVACEEEHIEVIKTLAHGGADLDISNGEALRYACIQSDIHIIKILVEYGANVNILDGRPLTESCEQGDVKVVEALLELGANPNAADGLPLSWASRQNNIKIVKALLKAKADPNGKNERKGEALSLACRYNHFEVVKILLENGADPNVRNNYPYKISLKNNNDKILNLLILYGAESSSLKGYAKKIINLKANQDKYYMWQNFCSSNEDKNIEELRNLALLQGVDNTGSKREICKKLADKYERKLSRTLKCENETSILGDPVELIPRPLLFTVKENGKNFCFNIIELIELIDKGETRNPFTRNELPADLIKNHYNKLKKILVKSKLTLVNILDEIKNNNVMDSKSIMKLKVVNIVALLKYPPTVEQILAMTESDIQEMVKLMNNNELMKVRSVNNINSFVSESLRILNIDDNNKDTRRAAYEIYISEVLS